jgi:hypothetical protein
LAASLPEGVESPDTGLWVPTADKKTVPPVERVAQAV